MIYKDFQAFKLSALGMGAMRLPVVDGIYSNIGQKATDEMVAYALENCNEHSALNALPDKKKPSACIGCRSSENICPQQIKIADAMTDFSLVIGM